MAGLIRPPDDARDGLPNDTRDVLAGKNQAKPGHKEKRHRYHPPPDFGELQLSNTFALYEDPWKSLEGYGKSRNKAGNPT